MRYYRILTSIFERSTGNKVSESISCKTYKSLPYIKRLAKQQRGPLGKDYIKDTCVILADTAKGVVLV